MSAAHDQTLNVGDVAQVLIRALIDATLTDPTTLFAAVERPDGEVLNTVDHATKVRATITGANRFPGVALDDFDPPITAGENSNGTGLLLVEFVIGIPTKRASDAAGDWKVTSVLQGAARGGIDRTVKVRRPAVDFVFTDSNDV